MTQRKQKWFLIAAVLIALLGAGANQIWQVTIDDRTDTKIVRTTSTCAQVDRLYSTVMRLMAGDSQFEPSQVQAMRDQRRDRLAVQGCKP